MVLQHAQQRTIILPGRKVLFVPMPKSGCTSMLWVLAELAALQPDTNRESILAEVSAEMLVHDLSRWPERHRWMALSPDEQTAIEDDPSWLRFTIVRDPVHRLFSAWQSKLLMREGRYADRFRDEPWFPRIPTSPDDIVEDFQSFVSALADPAVSTADAHWAPQTDVLEGAPRVSFIGRAENPRDTMRMLERHVGPLMRNVRPSRKNQSLLDYSPALFGPESVGIVNEVYGPDFDAFGYSRLDPTGAARLATWRADVKPLVPALQEIVGRNERIGDLVAATRTRLSELRDANEQLEKENAELRDALRPIPPDGEEPDDTSPAPPVIDDAEVADPEGDSDTPS